MIRFFLSYFLLMLVVGVCWHRVLTYLEWKLRERKARVCPSVGKCPVDATSLLNVRRQ